MSEAAASGPASWLLGVTGGIGTGKSSLCRMLSEQEGWPVIDADRIGHEALRSGSGLLPALRARFGAEVLAPDGSARRDLLAAAVFADGAALADLNRIVHPWILDRIDERMAALRTSGDAGIILLDAALLLDWLDRLRPDAIAVVTAPLRARVRRLERKGMNRRETLRRIRTQMADTERLARADWVIDNGGTLEELGRKARVLASEVRRRREMPPGKRKAGTTT